MEAALPQAEGRARGARLRRLHQQGPFSPAPDHAPVALELSHSFQDARVTEPRRGIEQLAQKLPLKVIQNCISRAIKKRARNGGVRQVAQTLESPIISSRPTSEQLCMPSQPLAKQEPLLDVNLVEAADIPAAVSSEAVRVLPEEGQMEEATAGGHASLTTNMQDWQGMSRTRSGLFLPAVTRPVCSFHDAQDGSPCIQQEQLQSAEVETSSHCNPGATTKEPSAKSPSSRGEEMPLEPPLEEQAPCSTQPKKEGWETWKDWLGLRPLLALASAPEGHADGKKTLLNGGEPCEERRRGSQGEEPSVASTPRRKVPSLFASQPRSGKEDARCMSPLMIMTPRVADIAQLEEGPYLEVPVNPHSEPQSVQEDGFHASLNVVLRLMEKIVAVLDGSSSMLAACSNGASTDEGQLVVDAGDAQASEESASVRDELTKSEGLAKQVAEHKGKHAECEETGDKDKEPVDMMSVEDQRKGNCRELTEVNTHVGPRRGSSQLVQAGNQHAPKPCKAPAANQEYHYLDLSREAWGPPPRVSSEGSCSARGNLAEESGEPSVPVIAAPEFTFPQALEETEETADDEDGGDADDNPPVLQVTHRAERLATASARHVTFSTQVTLRLPSSRTGKTEHDRSDSTDLLTILEKQAANQGLFCHQACLLPPPVRQQIAAVNNELAAPLVKAHDTENDRLWKLLREEVEAIPPMHLPAADKHASRSPADTSCSAQDVDAVEEDAEDLESRDLTCFPGMSSGSCNTTHQAQTLANPWQKAVEERWAPLSPLYPIHECEELDEEEEEADSRLSTR
ncbi:hypothetical protein ACSSS7_005273 [Eimeria intestinalis]